MSTSINPIATLARPFLEQTDPSLLVHSKIRSCIQEIYEMMATDIQLAKEGSLTINQLERIIAGHEYALQNKIRENSGLSARQCVQLNDLSSLKYLVWNEVNVNQID